MESLEEEANKPYFVKIEIYNSSKREVPAYMFCGMRLATFPVGPIVESDAAVASRKRFEDETFEKLERSNPSARILQTLAPEAVTYGYCPSDWLPNDTEIRAVKEGKSSLLGAGRVDVPAHSQAKHGVIDFCFIGSAEEAMQHCISHNIPHVEIGPLKQ